MSDTLIDPPPPPTVRDDAPARSSAARPSRRRTALAAVAIASLILLGTIVAVIYVFVWRYEPLARRHIPGNANIIARLEVADVALFRPVVKHLWPMLFEQPFDDDPASKKAGPSRAQRIRDKTGVSLATDVREVLVASVDATSWVMILGGRVPKDRFVKGVEDLAREEGWTGWRREGQLLVGPPSSRIVIGQADDGTVAVGTDTDIVTAALPATDEWKSMGLPQEGAVTFVATSDAWSGALSLATAAASGAGSLRRVDRVSGTITLGSSPVLSVSIRPAAGQDAASLAGDVERTLAGLRILLLLAPDIAGEKEALASTKVVPEGGDVRITTPWPYDGLDRACEKLAAWIRSTRAATPAPPPSAATPAVPSATPSK